MYYRKIVIYYIIFLDVFIKAFFDIVVTAFTQMVGKLIEYWYGMKLLIHS